MRYKVVRLMGGGYALIDRKAEVKFRDPYVTFIVGPGKRYPEFPRGWSLSVNKNTKVDRLNIRGVKSTSKVLLFIKL